MVLYSVASPFDVFPYTAPVNSVKAVKNGYVQYRRINGVNVAQSLFSTNPFDYISSAYFNPNHKIIRREK